MTDKLQPPVESAGSRHRVYGLGITTGTSETTYSPDDPVTREQMASFLARIYRRLTTEAGDGGESGGNAEQAGDARP